jgi:hypothetical protein
MLRKQNYENRWQKGNHAYDYNMPIRHNDIFEWQWRNHAMKYTKVQNGFQWCEHNNYEILFFLVHLEHHLMTPLKFGRIGSETTMKA